MDSIVWTNGTAQMRPRPAKTIMWGTYKPTRQRRADYVVWGN